jgi:hypothetical protein
MSEDVANRTYSDLLSDLSDRGRDTLVIVGSGISIAATGNSKFASWCGLLKDGVKECRGHDNDLGETFNTTLNTLIDSNDMDQLLAAASIVHRKLSEPPGRYARWLQKTVGSLETNNPAIIEAILNLSLPLATTNYDTLLSANGERASITWADTFKLERFRENKGNYILHLHGCCDTSESVILGLSDYEHLNNNKGAEYYIQSLRGSRTFVFVGCGVDGSADPHFRSFFAWVSRILPNSLFPAYIISRQCEIAKFKLKLNGMSNVSYIPYGTDHSELVGFLRNLYQDMTKNRVVRDPIHPSLPPLLPPCLFGRKDQVDSIVTALLQSNNVSLLGPPGVGKSTIALAVLRDDRITKKYYTRCYFVSSESA